MEKSTISNKTWEYNKLFCLNSNTGFFFRYSYRQRNDCFFHIMQRQNGCWINYRGHEHDHIILHYVNLGLIKLPDIVKLYTCQLFYDHLINKKSSNLNLPLAPEQHNYATRSVSLQHLNPESFQINIRKFCPTILACYYWNDIPRSIRNRPTKKLFEKALRQFYFARYWQRQFQHYIFIYLHYFFLSSLLLS